MLGSAYISDYDDEEGFFLTMAVYSQNKRYVLGLILIYFVKQCKLKN
jgi:hypothetical protein